MGPLKGLINSASFNHLVLQAAPTPSWTELRGTLSSCTKGATLQDRTLRYVASSYQGGYNEFPRRGKQTILIFKTQEKEKSQCRVVPAVGPCVGSHTSVGSNAHKEESWESGSHKEREVDRTLPSLVWISASQLKARSCGITSPDIRKESYNEKQQLSILS